MNKTTEDIQQERINVLNETIDIMNRIIKTNEEQINILKQTIEINNKTIEIQRHDNNLLLQHANKKTNE